MSIEAINEQLLRAIGVGVALLDMSELRIRFFNDTLQEWFADIEIGQPLSDLFTSLEAPAIQQALQSEGRYSNEVSFRLRRRTMTIALNITRALNDSEPVAVVVCQNISRIKELESMIDSYSMMVERNTREIKREKEQVEKLLLNLMPRSVYEEYKTFGVVTPKVYENVGVLCLDFSGFAQTVSKQDAGVIVSELNDIYTAFDRIGDQFGCERIKTVGDLYITVAGVPDPSERPAQAVADTAVRFLRYLEKRNLSHPVDWHCRIALASGSVIGSVVGVQKYIYDVFGPAVLDAMRLLQHAEAMQIVASGGLVGQTGNEFEFEQLGQASLSSGENVQLVRLLTEADASAS